MVFLEIWQPHDDSKAWSCIAVVSLSSCIFASTNAFTSAVIFVSVPEPGVVAIDPVSSYFDKNFAIPTQDNESCSFCSSKQIVGARYPCL